MYADADGDEALVVMRVSPAALYSNPAFTTWIDELATDISTNGLPGIDASVAEKAAKNGIDVNFVTSSPKAAKRRNKPSNVPLLKVPAGKKGPQADLLSC